LGSIGDIRGERRHRNTVYFEHQRGGGPFQAVNMPVLAYIGGGGAVAASPPPRKPTNCNSARSRLLSAGKAKRSMPAAHISLRRSREVTHLRSFRVTHTKISICGVYAWWAGPLLSSAPQARSGNVNIFIGMRGCTATCQGQGGRVCS
jgi:hypothetical protein